MKLYHVTPTRNINSILARGLLVKKSKTANKCIWLVMRSRLDWAIEHVAARHNVPTSEVTCILLEWPQVDCLRHGRSVFWSKKNIPPEWFYHRGIWM